VQAMHAHHDGEKCFPPAAIYSADGSPLLSWRVALLAYLPGGQGLYAQFHMDEAWDSPHNLALLKKAPKVFRTSSNKTRTSLRMFDGELTAFSGQEGPRAADYADGKEQTFLVVEAARRVKWTRPEMLHYRQEWPLPDFGVQSFGGFPGAAAADEDGEDKAVIKFRKQTQDGFYVLYADGGVRLASKTADEEKLRALVTNNAGEKVAPSDLGELAK
ncbi:MAG: DUF1559 domain-containing protein, partial [Planctomycetales bacterium]